jgi:uncharacterized protein YqfA (UPF0365 family)
MPELQPVMLAISGPLLAVGGVFLALLLLVFLAVFLRYFSLWIQCKTTRTGIDLIDLVMMGFRRVDSTAIVKARVMAVQSGISKLYPDITTKALESHYMAKGNVLKVIQALIAATRAQIPLDWQTAAAIDLAGRDILQAVQTSVYPKVIDCPDPKQGPDATLSAVCGDGIELRARARVTVKTDLKQLVGGATEETVIARVGLGIVQAIGKQSSYKIVLESPELISQEVLDLGLGKQTAFEIVSVDIADIDVGDNIGARLQADTAEAVTRVAQARAEQQRANMVAREQEMSARVQENRAKVVLAEAEIPKAVAEALAEGRLGLMDYYELSNVQAVTRMRSSIAGDPGNSRAG